MLSEQAFLNAGPLLVKGTAGAAAAGFIFNILMIARAPLQLFQAVSTSLLPHLTRLRAEGAETDFRESVRVTIRAIAAFAGGGRQSSMAIVGPELMQIAFGDKFTYERADLADRHRRDGPLPLRRDAEPGRPGPGPGSPRRGLLDRLRGRLRRLVPGPDRRGRVPPGRGRLPGRRGDPLRACSTRSTAARTRGTRTRSSRDRPRSTSCAWPRPTRGPRPRCPSRRSRTTPS